MGLEVSSFYLFTSNHYDHDNDVPAFSILYPSDGSCEDTHRRFFAQAVSYSVIHTAVLNTLRSCAQPLLITRLSLVWASTSVSTCRISHPDSHDVQLYRSLYQGGFIYHTSLVLCRADTIGKKFPTPLPSNL